MKFKKFIWGLGSLLFLMIFIYNGFVNIQTYWKGYHDVDMAYNFQEASFDINVNGGSFSMNEIYSRGIGRMNNSFVWTWLGSLLIFPIGICFIKFLRCGNE